MMNLPGVSVPADHWNRDTLTAPRDGRMVILASKCGKVIRSRWLLEPERWEGFNKGENPVAWQHWPEYPK